MKKFILPILLFLMIAMLMPFMVHAESCDLDKISIDSISLAEKSEGAVIKSEPVYKGLNVNYDILFRTTGDFVKYKLVVKNDSDIPYKISEDTSFNKSKYITYDYKVEEELKEKNKAIVYITITYSKEIDDTKFIDNKYIESNKAIIQLLDSDGQAINVPDTIKNPNTGDNLAILTLIIVLCISTTVLLVLNRKKRIKYMSMVLAIGLCVIPTLTYATECTLKNIKIAINTNVEISESYAVNYIKVDTVRSSDKDKYKIFDVSKHVKEANSCTPIIAKDKDGEDYEMCIVIFKTEYHVKGEKVNMLNEFSTHAFNKEGNLNELIVPTDNSLITDIWFYNMNSKTLSTNDKLQFWWGYYKEINNYNDINDMNFTGNISNNWLTELANVQVYSPNSFTMPKHDVFFIAVYKYYYPYNLPVNPPSPVY